MLTRVVSDKLNNATNLWDQDVYIDGKLASSVSTSKCSILSASSCLQTVHLTPLVQVKDNTAISSTSPSNVHLEAARQLQHILGKTYRSSSTKRMRALDTAGLGHMVLPVATCRLRMVARPGSSRRLRCPRRRRSSSRCDGCNAFLKKDYGSILYVGYHLSSIISIIHNVQPSI